MEALALSESASVKFVDTLDRSTTPIASTATASMLKVVVLETPPPGPGLKTLTSALPDCARSPIGIAVLRAELPKDVEGRSLPFHRMVVPATKPEPVMSNGTPGQPAGALVTDSEESTGTGLFAGGVGD